MDYTQKYLKYKKKYITLQKQLGGFNSIYPTDIFTQLGMISPKDIDLNDNSRTNRIYVSNNIEPNKEKIIPSINTTNEIMFTLNNQLYNYYLIELMLKSCFTKLTQEENVSVISTLQVFNKIYIIDYLNVIGYIMNHKSVDKINACIIYIDCIIAHNIKNPNNLYIICTRYEKLEIFFNDNLIKYYMALKTGKSPIINTAIDNVILQLETELQIAEEKKNNADYNERISFYDMESSVTNRENSINKLEDYINEMYTTETEIDVKIVSKLKTHITDAKHSYESVLSNYAEKKEALRIAIESYDNAMSNVIDIYNIKSIYRTTGVFNNIINKRIINTLSCQFRAYHENIIIIEENSYHPNSFDDFIFWIMAITFSNYLTETKENINTNDKIKSTLILVTNDKQKIIDIKIDKIKNLYSEVNKCKLNDIFINNSKNVYIKNFIISVCNFICKEPYSNLGGTINLDTGFVFSAVEKCGTYSNKKNIQELVNIIITKQCSNFIKFMSLIRYLQYIYFNCTAQHSYTENCSMKIEKIEAFLSNKL